MVKVLLLSAILNQWIPLAEGIYYVHFFTSEKVEIHAVRINPEKTHIVALTTRDAGKPLTLGQWCERFQLTAAINAGMFNKDFKTHTGYMKVGDFLNNPLWSRDYLSVLVFNPLKKGLPPVAIIDLDIPEQKENIRFYSVVIQNLRLVKYPGTNVWKNNSRKWPEASIAIDKMGNLLFIFTPTLVQMSHFNKIITSPPLEAVQAMHAEGGREAGLSIRSPRLKLDLAGTYQRNLFEEAKQTPVPNVIGVKPKR